MSEDADADFFKGLAQQSQLNAFADAGANPDEAASAITTARQMNLPPEVTALDPGGYAGVLKAQRNSEIISANPAIARYARIVPLATKVSNDDFENLDALHKALLLSVQGQAEDLSGKRGGFGPLDPLVQGATGGAASESMGLVAALPGRQGFFKPLIEGLRGISDRAVQTDHSAVGTFEYNVGSMAGQLVTDFLGGGLVQGAAGLVGGPAGVAVGTATGMASAAALAAHGRGLDEQDQADAANGTKTPELEKQLKAGVIGAATGALFSLGLHGPAADLIQTAVRDGIATALPRIALDTGATAALGAGINGTLQEVHDLVMDAGKPGEETVFNSEEKRAALADKVRSAMVDGALYMGMAHAFGIGSNVIGDRLAMRAADQAAAQHKAAMDAADATETKTRSPEAFRQFAEIAARDKTISIPADKIDELNMADTIRPLVSDFDEQMNLGRASGGDVTIPYSAYLAGVDGSMDSQMAKDLRHAPEGLTQNEAEELRLWHGTPHEFDSFDVSKVGTGEGAQSYGHGLYFAENKDVAEGYRQKLSGGRILDPELVKEFFAPGTIVPSYAGEDKVVSFNEGPKDAPLNWSVSVQKIQKDGTLGPVRTHRTEPSKQELEQKLGRKIGFLYGARIKANRDQFLDLDKSIKDQTPYIRERLKKAFAGEITDPNFIDTADANAGDWIHGLEAHYGDKAEVSRLMREAGIVGSKYLDQGSRSSEGTRNYVVFHHNNVETLSRNGEILNAPPPQAAAIHSEQVSDTTAKELYLAPLFPTNADAGMTKPMFERYSRLIEQRHAAQNDAALEAARIEIRRRDSQAWKDTVGLVRDELAAKPTPEWAAHDFITKRILNGEKIPDDVPTKLDRTAVERLTSDPLPRGTTVKGKSGVTEKPKPLNISIDNPGGNWLKEKIEDANTRMAKAQQGTYNRNVGGGKTTAFIRDIQLPTNFLKEIPGAAGENRAPGDVQFDELSKSVNERGFDNSKSPILIQVNHKGEPFIVEGNTRVAVASAQNIPFVHVEIQWMNGGETIEGKLSPSALRALVERPVVKGGVDPEEMAQLLGYRSGHELVQALAGLEKGRGDTPIGQYRNRLLDEATAKEMETRFGKFDDEIEREARATAMQHSVQEALHIEMQTLGDKIGAPPFKLDAIRDFVKEQFDRKSVKEARQLKAFSRMVGAEGRRAEMSLLAKNYQKAFQAKQKQLVAHLMASEAERFDREATKAMKRFDRLRRKTTIGSMDQGYLNQIHGLLNAFGMGVKRSPTELRETLSKTPLIDFVNEEANNGYDVIVSPLLYGIQPALKNATVETFRTLDNAIKSMSKIGRDLKKIEIDGQKQELHEVKTAVIEQIRKTPLRYAKDPGRIMKSRDTMQQLTSHFMQFEGILADIDRNDPDGIMSKVFRPMIEGKNRFNDMTVEAGKRLPEYSIKAANEVVPNDIFINPKTERPYELSRGDSMIIALYAGSKSGMDRLSKGYKLEPDQIHSWLNTSLRAEDWKWAQGMWDFFKWQWPQIEAKAIRTTGVAPDRIDGVPTTNQHGTFTGGYVPIMYDPFSKHTLTIDRQNSENTYQSSTPSKSSMKSRVDGMSDQLQIKDTFARLAMEIKKDFHDLAMDEPLKDLKKIILDSEVRQEIQKRFGPGPDGEIVPFIKYVANQYNAANKEMAGAQRIMGGTRRNLSIAALTYNLGIMLSPNTGNLASTIVKLGARPADTVHWILHAPEATKFIEENSNEIKHWDTNWNREAAETLTSLEGDSRWKAEVIRYGYHFAASIERHLGQIQWFAHYREALQKGETHDNAAYLADKSLREDFHRADVLAMSQAMRQSEAWKLTTLFYGYGQLVFNRVHRIGNLAKTGVQKFSEEDMVGARRDFSKAFALSMSHLVIPAALFGPLYIGQKKDSDSWLKYAGKLLLGQAGVAIPLGGRDIVAKALQGYDPHPSPIVGLGIGVYREVVDIARALGLSNKPISKTWLKNAIQTTGAGFGVPFSGQASRTVPFVWHWWDGTDPPHTLGDVVRGMQTGTTKGPR